MLITERYAYAAYGDLTITDANGTPRSASTESNRYLYTGREWDQALGLYHYRARMYDPVAGRFCSRDPIGYMGSEWKIYEYVQSNSVRLVDPTGRSSEESDCGCKVYDEKGGEATQMTLQSKLIPWDPDSGTDAEMTILELEIAQKLLNIINAGSGLNDAIQKLIDRKGFPSAGNSILNGGLGP